MARLAILASFLCVCLVFATTEETNTNSWLKLKMAMLRKNREEATRQIINSLLVDILSQRNSLDDSATGDESKSLGLSKKSTGWRTYGLPIQTRFAAFGSKLMPSREGGDHGSTLLRYGRSA